MGLLKQGMGPAARVAGLRGIHVYGPPANLALPKLSPDPAKKFSGNATLVPRNIGIA
jgi:hypothetical protein